MTDHQRRYDAARQRAADARHNADEYDAKATAARQAAVDADSHARMIAREAYRRGLGVLETRPVRTWPLGRLAGYKPPQVAPVPVVQECEPCGAELTATTCTECSHTTEAEREMLEELEHRLDLVPRRLADDAPAMTLVCVSPDTGGGYHLWDDTAAGERAAAIAAGASDANLYERGFCRIWRLTADQVGRALVNGAKPMTWTPYGLAFEHTGAP